jgi:excisionase family DNA binding protein
MSSPADKNLLSVKKASSLLEVSPDTLRRLDNKGTVVPTRGANGERLYSGSDISLLKQVLRKPLSEKSYGIQETANILRVSPQTIRRWEREGKISTTRTPGGQRLFTLKDIQALQNLPKKVQVFPPPQPPQTHVTPPTPKAHVSEAVSPILPFPIPQSVSTEPEIPAQVVFAKKEHKNFSPYIVLVLLLLLLGGTVAYIGSQTFFKSNASKSIEVAETTTESPIQQVAKVISNVFKKGSVMFQGQNDQMAEDNENFFWDVTNAFLGIGTNMPNSRLTVSGGVSGTSLVSLVSQEVGNILTATNNGQTVFNVDSSGNTQVAGALSDINDSSLNVLQNLAVGGDINVAGGDITSSKDLRVYSSTSTTVGSSSSPTTINGKDVYFKNGVLTNSIKLSNTATALPNGNTGIVDAIVDAWNHAGTSNSDEWSTSGGNVYPNGLTDNLVVGGITSAAPFYVAATTGDTKVGDLTVTAISKWWESTVPLLQTVAF